MTTFAFSFFYSVEYEYSIYYMLSIAYAYFHIGQVFMFVILVMPLYFFKRTYNILLSLLSLDI